MIRAFPLTSSPSIAPSIINIDLNPHSPAFSTMYLSILNMLRTSPFCKFSNNALSNLAPSGEYSYGPSSLNLCDKSPLAINTIVLI